MKVLITGATGFIGSHVARLLREKGLEVIALVREENSASVLKSIDVQTINGDVRDYDSIERAVKGCSQIYHLAADYRLWVPDPEVMYDINVQGTKNIMMAALESGVEKVIYTSTVGVFVASPNGEPSNEESLAQLGDMTGHYKRSKFIAEREVRRFIAKGVPVVIVNPSTPIGTMDRKPTPTGRMIVDFLEDRIPAYLNTGLNFVDVEDVALGHWLASLHGKTGERYILGNRNMSLRDFFQLLASITRRRPPAVRLPYLPVLAAAYINEAFSKVTRRHPRIPLTGVRMARGYMYYDCTKAIRELHLPQSPVEKAVEKAIDWFQDNGYIALAKMQGA
ncbi:MAG: hopanoid-associated sugar epimerase [Dissulfurispiraceae bacterium]|jgi:dihydroflavonol-4-reductase